MSLNFKNGKEVAIISEKKSEKILLLDQKPGGYTRIKVSEGSKLIPLLDSGGRSITYICGASGSGKSTFANNLIKNFNIMFPDACVYLFSKVSSDPAFDALEKKKIITRIPINEKIIENKVDVLNDIENGSLVIFDDIDTINDKNLLKEINNIKLQILEIGRHKNIYCIVTSHLINTGDRTSTRTMMNEMSNLVIFPKGGGSVYQQRYCLKNYLGFTNAQCEKILNVNNSRWVLISKNFPQYILTERECYLV